jgi:8-oxo-dGTP diphosphatase
MVDGWRSAEVFCDECGRSCDPGDEPAGRAPACPVHGPRWRLVRSAPCTAVLIERAGRVLLSQRAHEPWAGRWEVPGGFLDQGEHPEDGARREVREELGIEVELTGLLGIYVHPVAGQDPLLIVVYVGTTDAADGDVRLDPVEVADWCWFDPADVPEVLAGDHRRRIDDWLAGRAVPLPAGADG